MSPIVTQVHDTRSISPANCCPFANFWSTVLSPETWNRAPPSHLKVWPASLSWYRPHFNILSHKHWDQQIYNWPFSSNNAFGTLFTHAVVGCKTTPWNMAIIHHCWSFPSFSNLHLSTYKHLLLITGRLVCRWQHLESCLCPPPLSAQHTRLHVQGGADCQLGFPLTNSLILAPC